MITATSPRSVRLSPKAPPASPQELRFIRTRTATSYPISRPPNGLPNLTYPEPSEVHYTYQYDSFGNWIDKTVTHGKGSTFTTHRELTYY